MGVFELYRDSNAKFRFRILDDDGSLVAVSEAHEDKASAVAAIKATRDSAATSRIVDLCGAPFEEQPAESGHFLG
ncbi:YegP family protein [Arthrobacter sp. GCM10027362]|uniref:YegP family protein n=1 Tax=Arthrobacter sp. GCM10027362 TaxID=3273379 RepID=UPI0036282F63